jgi:hypothetical protein
MIKTPAEFAAAEVTIGHWIRFVGGGIEIARRIEGYQVKSQSVFPLQDLSVD